MKKLGKLLMFVGVLSLAWNFTACKPNDPNNPAPIVEDGFYVAGEATGSTALSINYRMASGINEYKQDKEKKTPEEAKRAGMYEKYIALEANKDFTLLLKEGTVETKYSAVLTDFDTKGENDQPTVVIQRGKLITGANAAPMKVKTSGLYHIVLDLNTPKDLADPLIIIAPVQWGVRGVNDDWGWKKMKSSAFNSTTMVWDTIIDATNAGEFKFAYGGGWKIQLDDAGLVKANTNLGLGMIQGAKNIDMPKGTKIKLTLTWKLAGGEVSKNYTMALTGNIVTEDPAGFVAGFSGDAFAANTGNPGDWKDPAGPTLAIFDKAASTITNATTKAGTYVYNIKNLKFDAGKSFKVRYNGAWIGAGDSRVTISGATFTGTDNFTVSEAVTYANVKFEVTWSGSKATALKITFTK